MDDQNNKYKLLLIGLVIDVIGILTSSWVLPLVGDMADVVWAPLSAWLMTRLYKGTSGKVGGVITFVEEIVPGLDIIPSFTLMWMYTYIFKKSTIGESIEKKFE